MRVCVCIGRYWTQHEGFRAHPAASATLHSVIRQHKQESHSDALAAEKTMHWLQTEASCDVLAAYVPAAQPNDTLVDEIIAHIRALGNQGDCASYEHLQELSTSACLEPIKVAAVQAMRHIPCSHAESWLIALAVSDSEAAIIRKSAV